MDPVARAGHRQQERPAPLGGEQTGRNPTNQGNLSSKRHLLVDARGAPVAVAVSGANEHDLSHGLELLGRSMLSRPVTHDRVHQLLCTDKGYGSDPLLQQVWLLRYHLHIRRQAHANRTLLDPAAEQRHPGHRQVGERTPSWQKDFRSRWARWAKKAGGWLALIHLACALVL